MKRRATGASASRKVKGLRAKIKTKEAELTRLLTELQKAKALLSGKARGRKAT